MNKPIPTLNFFVREIRENAGLQRSLSLPASECLDLAVPQASSLEGPVSIQIEFSVGGNSLLLQARFSGIWKAACSRCLSEHPVAFSGQWDETYALSTESIDLSEELRQALLLELPQRSLCRPSCRGLCSSCGKNLNEGPCGCVLRPSLPSDTLKKLIE